MLSRMHGGARRWMWRAAALSGVVGCASWVFAEAVGSPASLLKKGQWAMALGGGAISGRALSPGGEATAYQLGHFRGYGLTDWLSVYGKLGGAYLEINDASVKHPDGAIHSFGAGLLLGVQLKARIWRHVKTGWEWDGSVQVVDMRFRHRTSHDGHWREWVLASSVAKDMGRFKPYFGLKYSMIDMDAKIRRNGQPFLQRNYTDDAAVGPFFGTDVYFGPAEDVIMNVETAYVDGPELNLAIKYLF